MRRSRNVRRMSKKVSRRTKRKNTRKKTLKRTLRRSNRRNKKVSKRKIRNSNRVKRKNRRNKNVVMGGSPLKSSESPHEPSELQQPLSESATEPKSAYEKFMEEPIIEEAFFCKRKMGMTKTDGLFMIAFGTEGLYYCGVTDKPTQDLLASAVGLDEVLTEMARDKAQWGGDTELIPYSMMESTEEFGIYQDSGVEIKIPKKIYESETIKFYQFVPFQTGEFKVEEYKELCKEALKFAINQGNVNFDLFNMIFTGYTGKSSDLQTVDFNKSKMNKETAFYVCRMLAHWGYVLQTPLFLDTSLSFTGKNYKNKKRHAAFYKVFPYTSTHVAELLREKVSQYDV